LRIGSALQKLLPKRRAAFAGAMGDYYYRER